MTARLRRLLVALAVALAALGSLAGCGSSKPKVGASTLLRQTFTGNHHIRSGHVAIDLSATGAGQAGAGAGLSATVDGRFQSRGPGRFPAFDFRVTAPVLTAGALSTGTRMFLDVGSHAYSLPAGVFRQISSSYVHARASSPRGARGSALPVHPLTWLHDPKVVGTQDVAGVKTDHVAATVDVPRLLGDVNTLLASAGRLGIARARGLPSALSPSTRAQIVRAVRSATVDVFSGSADHTLRRLLVHLVLDIPADLRPSLGGLPSADVRFSVQLSQINQPVTIVAPRSSLPLSALSGGGGLTP